MASSLVFNNPKLPQLQSVGCSSSSSGFLKKTPSWLMARGQRCAAFEVCAMTADKIPLIVRAVFTISRRTSADSEESFLRYAELSESLQVDDLVKGVIQDETRLLAASITMDRIFDDVESFFAFQQALFERVQRELDQFGLIICDQGTMFCPQHLYKEFCYLEQQAQVKEKFCAGKRVGSVGMTALMEDAETRANRDYWNVRQAISYIMEKSKRQKAVDRQSDEEVVNEDVSMVGDIENPDGAASISDDIAEPTIADDTAEPTISTAVTHGDIDSDTMPELEDGRSQIVHLAPAGASRRQLSRELFMMGSITLVVGVDLVIHELAATGSFSARRLAIRYGILPAIAAAVPLEMTTSFFLPRSRSWSFHTFAEVLQRVGVVLLIVASAVGGVELTLKA